MKKILVIDDSALMRRVVSDIIDKTTEYSAAYKVSNALDGLDCLSKNSDIKAIICDLNMPKMNGLDFLRAMSEKGDNTPVIIFSSSEDSQDTITALELGAIEFVKKPSRMIGKDDSLFDNRLKSALDMATSLKERRETKENKARSDTPSESKTKPEKKPDIVKTKINGNKLVALVCSTGGPKALQYVLPKLPKNIDAPVIIVQHMPAGFTNSLSARLDYLSEITVKEAEEAELIKKGVCYIAMGGKHLTLSHGKDGDRIAYDDSPPVVGLKPCGNIMYHSLLDTEYDEIICVVLTGMGADGTKGITELSKTKNIYVIAQNEESSTVYGMPKSVYEKGLTDCVCDLNDIADAITKKVGVR